MRTAWLVMSLALVLCSFAQRSPNGSGVSLTFVTLHAQEPSPPPAAAGPGWQFADEEEQAPTWREIVGAQAADLTGFAAFTALALVGFFRKSVRWKYVTLGVAVLYLGFVKSQLI